MAAGAPALPPGKPKSRNGLVIGLVIGGVVLALCALCALCATSAIIFSSDDENAKDNAGMGTPVRDGKFEFTVNQADCGVEQVGNEYLNKTAQGQYCLVNITTENIGQEPQTFFVDAQYAYGPNEEKFNADSEASLYTNDDANLWSTEINPGNSVTGVIVFDIPKDARLASLELHDSAFSGGVTVNL